MKTSLIFLTLFMSISSFLSGQCGDVLISSQSQIDSFSCTVISGNMIISDDNDGVDDIVNLVPLRLAGFRLVERSLIIKNSPGLLNLDGLDSLEAVGIRFQIVNNENLQRLKPAGGEEFVLNKVGFDLAISDCPRLKSIDGLSNLDTIGFGINFSNLDSLERVDGLQGITELSKLQFRNNSLFSSPLRFRGLESIGDSLIITGNSSLLECCWVLDLADLAPAGSVVLSENGEGCSDINNIEGPAPVLVNCPDDTSVTNLAGLCHTQVTLLNPELVDGCNTFFRLEVVDALSEFFLEVEVLGESTEIDSLPVGFYRFLWTAENGGGESASCDIRVAVEDIQFPVFLEDLANDTLGLIGTSCLARYSLDFPEIDDNCTLLDIELYILDIESMDTVYITEAVSGVNYQIDLEAGSYEVVASVTDASRLSDITRASILVPDEGLPSLTNCPDDEVIILEEDCVAEVSYTAPGVIGTCSDEVIISELLNELGVIIDGGEVTQDSMLVTEFSEGVTEVRFRVLGAESATCSFFVTVSGGANVNVELSSVNIGCDDESGSVSADLDTAGFSFLWIGPGGFMSDQLSSDVSVPGVYFFSVEDSMGCVKSFSLDVFQGGSDVEIEVVKGAINCELGERKLKTEVDLVGYEHFWTGPDSFYSELSEPFISLGGWYYLRAEGNFGCIGFDSIFIEHDIIYEYDLQVVSDSASIVVQGGTPPFTFLWDNSISGESVSGLEAGEHFLRIVDGLGCAQDIKFQVVVSSTLEVEPTELIITPNPFVNQVQLYTKKSVKFNVYNTVGVKVMSGVNMAGNAQMIGDGWKAGLYFIVTDKGEIHKVLKF